MAEGPGEGGATAPQKKAARKGAAKKEGAAKKAVPRKSVAKKKTAREVSPHDFVKGTSYAPAPESTDHIRLKSSYDLFIGGKWVKAQKRFKTINPASEETIAEVGEAGPRMVDRAVEAAREAYEKTWKRMPGRERGKYLFRIARLIQERAREFAVIESMDGGKPIRESRDVDLPLVAAHFFYYAGWADKLDYAFPGRKAGPLGVAGQVIPWNFPLLMAAWKARARIGVRQHGHSEAGGDDTAHRVETRRALRGSGTAPPGWSTSSRARARPGSGWWSIPGSTRWPSRARPRWASSSRERSPAPARGSPSSSAGRPRTSSSTTRR